MKFFQKNELKLLWPFYLDSLISPMLFFMPAFIIVYFSGIGLTGTQMGFLLAIYPLSSLLFEIPTGAIADLYGRKFSVLLGYILEGIVMLSLFFWKDYYLMLFSFAFLGLAGSFSSGSKEAWIADLIKKEDKKMLHGFFSKTQALSSFAFVVSGIIGAFLVKNYDISIIWIMAFLSFVISLFVLLFAKEYAIIKKTSLKNSVRNLSFQAKKSLSYSYRHQVIFYFLLAGFIAVISGTIQSGISWIPLLTEFGMKEYQFGYMWSAMSLVIMLSPILAAKFLKKQKEKNFIVLGTALGALITLFILFAYNLFLALFVMFLGLFFYYSSKPAERVYFHRFIPSKLRATIGSIESMFLSIAAIIALPLAGFLLDKIGAKYTIFISAILMIPSAIIFYKIKEEKQPKEKV